MRKKLLIILGAGSSIDQGMPSVADLGASMKQWSAEWPQSDPALFAADNYFAALWQSAETYYSSRFLSFSIDPNFERILGDMAGLAHWVERPPFGNPLRQIVCGDLPPSSLHFPFAEGEALFGPYILLNSQLGYLLKHLAEHVRERCRRFQSTNSAFSAYQNLLAQLRDEFEVGIYNLNYDNVALTAWPAAFTGFGPNGQFDPDAVHSRQDWGFIYHLHGSVHHTLRGSSTDSSEWQHDLNGSFKDGDEGQATKVLSEGKSFPRSTLIAGGFKLDQLLIEPYHSFYAALIRHVYEADAVLIGGYGFGEAHVNRALRNCLERGQAQRPAQRPPVVILEWSKNGGFQMDTRQDIWAMEMRRSLCVAGPFRCEMPEEPQPNSFAGMIPRNSFEISSVHKVAVWHGGFCEAGQHMNGIREFLSTGRAGALGSTP